MRSMTSDASQERLRVVCSSSRACVSSRRALELRDSSSSKARRSIWVTAAACATGRSARWRLFSRQPAASIRSVRRIRMPSRIDRGLRLTRRGHCAWAAGSTLVSAAEKPFSTDPGSSSSSRAKGGAATTSSPSFARAASAASPMRRPCVANLLDERGQGKADDDGSDEHDTCKDDA